MVSKKVSDQPQPERSTEREKNPPAHAHELILLEAVPDAGSFDIVWPIGLISIWSAGF